MDDVSVTQAAYGIGYASLSAFNAAFLEISGQTPTDYRVGVRGAGRLVPAPSAVG